jgi:hypothetical protein
MADTYTNSVQLAMPAFNQSGWNVEVNANCTLLDVLNPVGDFCCTTTEVPSATLNVKVAGGQFVKADGSVVTYAGTASQAITTATTKVLYLDGTASWALTAAASYPTTAHVRIATVVAGATTITSIADNRQCFEPVGTLFDGTTINVGTTTGLQIGTATSQKLGFYGKTPVIQPTMGAATASSSYTTAEQGMLNAVYAAVRALGLGS